MIWANIFIANAVSLNLYFRYEHTHSFYTGLVAVLQAQPEFDGETPVAICGQYQEPYFLWDDFYFVADIMGSRGMLPNTESAHTFLVHYLGFRNCPPFAEENQIQEIKNTEEFAQMPCYPYHGSTKLINDVLVVKLSNS